MILFLISDDDLDFESEYLDLLYEADRQLDKLGKNMQTLVLGPPLRGRQATGLKKSLK